jgi:hypothetical protein
VTSFNRTVTVSNFCRSSRVRFRGCRTEPVMLIVGKGAVHPLTAKNNEKKIIKRRCGIANFFCMISSYKG